MRIMLYAQSKAQHGRHFQPQPPQHDVFASKRVRQFPRQSTGKTAAQRRQRNNQPRPRGTHSLLANQINGKKGQRKTVAKEQQPIGYGQ